LPDIFPNLFGKTRDERLMSTRVISTAVASDVIVVARRWDGLGGRLHAILNGLSMARALGLEFRFVWPRNFFTALQEPREIFDGAFLARFEIAESACDRTALPPPTTLSLAEARTLCRAAEPNSMIDVRECFGVLAFADESAAAAAARFRAGWKEIAWSGAVRAVIESISRAADPRGYSAIHIRAGDIVGGDWRQFVPVEKFMPTAYVEFAVETLTGRDAGQVVLVSDNDRYVRYLKARFDLVRSPSDLIDSYARLSEAQRALTDVLVLSRARRVVGPPTSAFSQLAAHLSGLDVLSIADLVTEDAARRRLRDGIAHTARAAVRRNVLRPLLARDICWFLDVFPGHLAVREYLEMAREAVRLEPDFCGALNRLAIAAALVGDRHAAAVASSRALEAAGLAKHHADPLFESLAMSISTRMVVAFGARRDASRRFPEWLALASVLRRFGGGFDVTALLEDIEESVERCEALTPFQTDKGGVMFNLLFQRAALTWASTGDGRSHEAARRAMRPAGTAPWLLPSWQRSGFSALAQPGSFPQTLRNLEITSIRMAHAIGASLSDSPLRPPPMGNVETTTISPSGLRWVAGWAYDPEAGREGLRVGLVSEDGVASGGKTFLPRPDVAAALDDPRAMDCGFAFPVPETLPGEAGDLRAKLRIPLLHGCTDHL
jgi:hypothetical protein